MNLFVNKLMVLLFAGLFSCLSDQPNKGVSAQLSVNELIGIWKIAGEDDDRSNIVSISFLNDSVAEVQFSDSHGSGRVPAVWRANYEKRIGNAISIHSDILLSYNTSKSDHHVLLIKTEINKNLPVLLVNNNYFEKSEK